MATSKEDKIDFYAALNVEKTASEGQIKTAYKKLALKHHPDRNRGSPEAAEQFKKVSTAYSILSDPNKRRQYDLSGESGMEFESVDVEAMGGISRMFGALLNKIGMPIPTQISQAILTSAREICDDRIPSNSDLSTGKAKNGVAKIVHPVVFGEEFQSRVDKQDGHFYRLTLSREDAAKGVLVLCRSSAKGKFKMVLFDSTGAVRLVQESTTKKKYTIADLLFTPFEILDLPEAWPKFNLENAEDTQGQHQIPEIFSKLSGLTPCHQKLEAGEHLFCVYGDNWFSAMKYSLRFLIAESTALSASKIQTTERLLLEKKQTLSTFQEEYMLAKSRFEAASVQLLEHEEETEELLTTREAAYEEFFQDSSTKYCPSASSVETTAAAAMVEGEEDPNSIQRQPSLSSFTKNMFSGISYKFRRNSKEGKEGTPADSKVNSPGTSKAEV